MKRLRMRSKKAIYVGSGVAFALLCSAYATWSVAAWNSYGDKAAALVREGEQAAESTFAMPSDSAADKTKKVEAIGNMGAEMASRAADMCHMNGFTAWQAAIPALAEKKRTCDKMAGKIGVFAKEAQDFAAFHQDASAYQKSLEPLLAADELSEKEWSSRLAAWQQHVDELSNGQVNEQFKSVRDVAIEKEEDVISAWKALLAAHKAKDEKAFAKAKDSLNDTYGALGAVSDESRAQSTKFASDLSSLYEAAF